MGLVEVESLGTYAARIWLNRSRTLNALHPELMIELDATFRRLEAIAEMRVVVFQGRGAKAFAVGADLKVVASIQNRAEARAFSAKGQAIFQHFAESRLVTVAVIQGYALGGGLELALALDLRLAGHSAKMGLPEVGLGLIPGFGGTQRLARLIGESRALWMLLSGERVDADQAYHWGLVNWLVEDANVEMEISQIVQRLSQRAPRAMAAAKALVRGQADLSAGLGREADALAELMVSHDARVGLEAFFQRTEPKFDGS